MHSSDLFPFGTEKAVPDIWSSNWNWVFTCFNFTGWLYVVKFRESSRIRMRRFLKPRKKNIRSSFWINLIHKCCNIYDIQFMYSENFVRLELLFCMFNFHLLQIMPIACFCWLDSSFKFVIYVFPQATLYVAIWIV